MKQPKSPLPWRLKTDFTWQSRTYEIRDAKDKYFCHDEGYYDVAPEKEDAEYIVEACNNYPKAMALLEKMKSNMPDPAAGYEEAYQELLKFLENKL